MERNNKEKSMVCDCENCQVPWYRNHHRHFFLRWFLGLIILGLTFVVAFKLGEFKQMFDDLGLGYSSPEHGVFLQRGYPIMSNLQVSPQSTTSTKTTTTK